MAPSARAEGLAVEPVHVPELDGVRGLAIFGVVTFHARLIQGVGPLDPVFTHLSSVGWTGVDLFLVLSGFLITGILLDSGRAPLRYFYGRRAVRILPLYYVALVVFFGVALAQSGAAWEWHRERALQYWLYVQNWQVAGLGQWPAIAYTNHFWSLNIEEQFYILWPLIVRRLGRERLLALCAALFVGALGLRTWMVLEGANWVSVYVLTPARMDSLVVGGWLAALIRGPRGLAPLRRWIGPVLLSAAAFVVLANLLYGRFHPSDNLTLVVGHSLVALGFGALIAAALAHPSGSRVRRFLSWRGLRVLGKYSYAIYVVHWPIVVLLGASAFRRPEVLGLAVPTGTLTYLVHLAAVGMLSGLVAVVSWRLLEEPFLRLKRHFPLARRL